MWFAGGGVKGGVTHGKTDEFGFEAVENPVHLHDIHATILHLLGMDHERLTYRYGGRDFRPIRAGVAHARALGCEARRARARSGNESNRRA